MLFLSIGSAEDRFAHGDSATFLTIELSAELEAKLRVVAAQQRLSLSELALCALEQWVTSRQQANEQMTSGEYLLSLAEKHSMAITSVLTLLLRRSSNLWKISGTTWQPLLRWYPHTC